MLQCGPNSQNLTPSSHCCLTRQPPFLHARCNCRPFVFIVVWCIARQADHNGETVKYFHNYILVLSQFRTPYCTNLRQYSNWPKRGGPHDNALILYCTYIFASTFCARKFYRPITLQPSVATATCRKACFTQMVLLQYKTKPYLGFQTKNGLKKLLFIWNEIWNWYINCESRLVFDNPKSRI